jgi:hypothetical protein
MVELYIWMNLKLKVDLDHQDSQLVIFIIF